MAAIPISDVFVGATDDGSTLTIPHSALNSVGSSTEAREIMFGLVDGIAAYIAATGLPEMASTEAQRVVDADTIRKDYTFRFNLAWSEDTLDVEGA